MIRIAELLTELIKLFNNFINLFVYFTKDKFVIGKKYIFIEEEGKPIECLDFLKSIERYNKDVIPYELLSEYVVKGKDLLCKRNIYCKSAVDNFSVFEFFIVSSSWNDFNKSKYYCLDLNSPINNEIKPQLKSNNGFAKRLSFSLNHSVNKNDDIKVQLNYTNKGCYNDKKCYIIADTKYKKLNLNKYTVIIRFENSEVDNIRIYLIKKNKYNFLEKIFPINESSNFYQEGYITFVYEINIKLIKSNTSLVYYFDK